MASDFNDQLYLKNANFGVFLIALLFVPVLDSIRVFVARAAEGRSPFSPDRNHIHHIIMDRFELSHRQTTLRILLINIIVSWLFWAVCFFFSHLWAVLTLITFSILFSLYLRNLRQQLRVNN